MRGYSFRSLTDLVLKIFKTQVNAGTGLSGGGSLEADRTLSVEYGTAAGTAAQGNDSRLSNSREWTASTVSQAEAEAGTATTRRAFTAQRVRQAIVAWWSNITGVFGRDLVTSANNTVARDKLGLFTSALRWPTWAEVTGKPTTFPSSSHTHPWSQIIGQPVTATRWPSLAEVTGTPANYPTTWNSVAAKPAQATRWPTFAEVTDKPTNYPTNWATVSDKPIVQTVGTSTTNLMSQKAVTDELRWLTVPSSKQTNGYQRLPSGVILQWGSISIGDNQTIIELLPIPFTTAFFNVTVSLSDLRNGGTQVATIAARPEGLAAVRLKAEYSYSGVFTAYWFAIGI